MQTVLMAGDLYNPYLRTRTDFAKDKAQDHLAQSSLVSSNFLPLTETGDVFDFFRGLLLGDLSLRCFFGDCSSRFFVAGVF